MKNIINKKSICKKLSVILLLTIIMNTATYSLSFIDKPGVYGPVISDEAKRKRATYSQFEAHPKNCYFGNGIDNYAIKSVEVSGRRKKYMSLTFDSSWNNTQTYALLDLLDKYNAKATFFLTAFFVRNNPEQVKEISRRGHEIGNHTNTHKSFLKFDPEKERDQMVDEIMLCHKEIKDLLGIDMCLFRFPYGDFNQESIQLVKELGYYPIQWTADSNDWRNISVDAILNIFKSKAYYKPGSILLFHNGAMYTVEALETILKDITDAGLRCVRVSDLIYTEDFTLLKNCRMFPHTYKANKGKTSTKSDADK